MKGVILAGGSGLRLWPLSRKKTPKQFLSLVTEKTMFAETIHRNKELCDQFIVMTNAEYRWLAENDIQSVENTKYRILLETIGRNTAPAIGIAAMICDPEELVIVMPADAYICGQEGYANCVEKAKELAKAGHIVTFGIRPTEPHTGYGYIKYTGTDVTHFREKPDFATAQKYYESGEYLWNSGMFLFKAGVLLEEMKKHCADIYDGCKALVEALEDEEVVTLPKDMLSQIRSESIDFAVMEKTSNIKVIPSDFNWDDIGGMEAVCNIQQADENKNSSKGENIIISDSKNTSIINETAGRLVVANHVDNLIVVNTNNATFITQKGSSQEIKSIIESNKEAYGVFFDEDVKSYRPWGYYEVLVNEPKYKVKKISVFPGKRLSLQSHDFRTEHWVVVEGVASITIGNTTKDYYVNESVYVPLRQIHRLANNTDKPLEIIEVALGEKITEDDITRYEDDFERSL